MQRYPDLAVDRLGPAEIDSPLCRRVAAGSSFFVDDNERTLFDTVGRAAQHWEVPEQIDPANLEVAGPRQRIYFAPEKTRAAIVTCGGVCPGVNDVIRALVRELILVYGVQEVLGLRYGFQGMVPSGHEPIRLTPGVVEPIHHQGGTFLGTSRGPQKIDDMLAFLTERRIDILFAIGGDGTQRGALALAQAARARKIRLAVVGLPKTIDNDLAYIERTFGFETAYTIAESALKAAHAEATSAYNGIGLVKLMGRHSGSLTMLAAMASGDVDFVLIPEAPFQLDGQGGLLQRLHDRLHSRGHVLIAVAEGAAQEQLVEERTHLGFDASGNRRLADVGAFLRRRIEDYFRQKSIPINLRYIDPSYLVRSAPAIATDSVFCLQLAQNAVHAAMTGRTAMVVGIWKNTFTHVPMSAVVSESKQVDPNGPLWLTLLQSIGQPQRIGE